MGKLKKRLFWFIGFFCISLVFLFLFILFLPKIINLDPIKQKAIAEFSSKTGIELSIKQADLILLPRPKILARQVDLEIPGKVNGTVKSLGIVLGVSPFSKKKIDLAGLEMEDPDIILQIQSAFTQEKMPAISFANMDKTILSFLTKRIPGTTDLAVKIVNGHLSISGQHTPGPWFSGIQGDMKQQRDSLHVDITCTSNLWEKINVTGMVNRKEPMAAGQIDLTGCKPQAFLDFFIPDSGLDVVVSHMNLKTEFKLDIANGLSFEFESMLPSVSLDYDQNHIHAKGIEFKGNVQSLEGHTNLSIAELTFDYPGLTLSGNLYVNQHPQKISLALEGKKIDLDTLRKEILAFSGNSPRTQKVVEVVKGGYVPNVTVSAQGTIADIRHLDSWFIKAHMTRGKIFIPKAELDLTDVAGDAVIKDRMLTGDNLSAALADTRGNEGKLSLGLPVKNAPFHLDIGLDADLAQLPFILKRFVKHKGFIREINFISGLEGRAKGKLILGENTSRIRAHAEAVDFRLNGKYKRIPFPLTISGNRFSYSGKTIFLENAKGHMGKSSFSGITGRLDWSHKPDLNITSGRASIDLDEMYPWLAHFENLPLSKSPVKDIRGQVNISRGKVEGPIGKLRDFTYDISGHVVDLKARYERIDGPIHILQSSFQLSEDGRSQNLTFKDTGATILDATLALSGQLKDWRTIFQTEIQMKGTLGPSSNQWIGTVIHIPSELALCSPITVSEGEFNHKKQVETSFKGKLNIQNGPVIMLDVYHSPKQFAFRDLNIKDAESQATIHMMFQKENFNLKYTGRLVPETFDRLFSNTKRPRGSVEGDFQLHIPLDRFWQSSVQGHLKGQILSVPWDFGIPVKLSQFEFSGNSGQLNIQSARFTYEEKPVELAGSAAFSPDNLFLNMNLTTDGINWGKLKQDFDDILNRSSENQESEYMNWPVKGFIHINAESLTISPYTWHPFHSDIILDNGSAEMNIIQANICHMPTSGVIQLNHDELSLNVKISAQDQQLGSIIQCFFDKEKTISGQFDLYGEIIGQGKRNDIDHQLQGSVELSAHDGRIFRDSMLAKVFTYLNVTEGLWGELPSIGQKGIGYHSISVKGDIENGKLKVTQGIMDGEAMKIVGMGTIDLINRQLDIVLLLAPLKTIDRIIKHIPVIGRILGGSLVSIPVKVTGEVTDPKVTTLAPAEIGAGMVRMLERIVKLPIDIFHIE